MTSRDVRMLRAVLLGGPLGESYGRDYMQLPEHAREQLDGMIEGILEHYPATPVTLTDRPLDEEEFRAIRSRWATGPERYQADADALIGGLIAERRHSAELNRMREATEMELDAERDAHEVTCAELRRREEMHTAMRLNVDRAAVALNDTGDEPAERTLARVMAATHGGDDEGGLRYLARISAERDDARAVLAAVCAAAQVGPGAVDLATRERWAWQRVALLLDGEPIQLARRYQAQVLRDAAAAWEREIEGDPIGADYWLRRRADKLEEG